MSTTWLRGSRKVSFGPEPQTPGAMWRFMATLALLAIAVEIAVAVLSACLRLDRLPPPTNWYPRVDHIGPPLHHAPPPPPHHRGR